MSHGWLKQFNVKVGENAGADVPLYLKNDVGLIYKSDFCPCSKWYIVTPCPCSECVTSRDWLYIGRVLRFPELRPSNGQPHPAAGKVAFDDAKEHPICAVDVGMEGPNLERAVMAQTYGFIKAIRHQTRQAPFSGTISAKAYMCGPLGPDYNPGTDRTLIASLSGASVSQGEQKWLGCTEYYTSQADDADKEESDAWAVDPVYVEEQSAWRLDLIVTFTPISGTPQSYTIRRPVVFSDYGDDVQRGTVYIVSSFGLVDGDDDDCGLSGNVDGIRLAMYPYVLKGPFDTPDEANYVYDTWKTTIDAWADKCVCAPSGCEFKEIGYNFINPVPDEWGFKLEGFGGVGDPVANFGCETWPVRWSAVCGSSIILVKTDANGIKSIVGGSGGILQPCERIQAYATSFPEGDPPDLSAWDFTGDANYAAPPPSGGCEVDQEDWDDIPANSAALFDYLNQ